MAERESEFGGQQEAALDLALETLMVEAYQLAVDKKTLLKKCHTSLLVAVSVLLLEKE